MNKIDFFQYTFGLSLLLKISESLLLKLPRGTLVRVNSPIYAAGLMGVIQSHEKSVSRWLIRLQNNPFEDNSQSVILSLEASDFQVIELPSVVENPDSPNIKQ